MSIIITITGIRATATMTNKRRRKKNYINTVAQNWIVCKITKYNENQNNDVDDKENTKENDTKSIDLIIKKIN